MALPVSPTADLKLTYVRDVVNRTYLVDLVLTPAGDLRLVAGLDRLEQDIRRWLQVALGHYVFDVTWGDPLWAERGRPQPAHVADLVQAALKEAEAAFLRAQVQAAAEGYLSTDEQLDHFEDVQVMTYPDDPGRVDVLFTLVARSGNNRPAELWVPAGPFPTGILAPKPPILTITAVPGSLGPDGVAALSITYDGADVLLLSITHGGGTLLYGGNSSFSFQGLGVLTTFTGVTYTAPSSILAPDSALITAEATSGSLITAVASVAIALVPAPPLTMHFQDAVLLPGSQTQLLVTYSGAVGQVVTLSVSDGTLAEYALGGTGHSQTTGITYTAPSAGPGAGVFMPGTGFAGGAGLALPLVVTATGGDGTSTATAAATIVAGLGGAMSGAAVGGAARLAQTLDPGVLTPSGSMDAAIVPHGDSMQGAATYGQLTSQSVSGSGTYGQLTSQSVQGGGSVSSIPFRFHTDSTNGTNTPQSIPYTFFKAGGTPSGNTTILDINFGASGWMRAKLTAALHVIAECSLFGETHTVDANAGNPISVGAWYWFGMSVGAGDNGFHLMKWVAQVWAQGGITAGQQATDFGQYNVGNGNTYNGVFGYGTTQTSGYANWPNTAGWQLSKGMVYTAGNFFTGTAPFIGPPSADRTVDASTTALWLCRDTVGTTSGIVDSTTNHYDLTPGPSGLLVVADGPYP